MLLLMSVSPLLFEILLINNIAKHITRWGAFLGVFSSCIVPFYGGIYVAKQKTNNVGWSSLVGAILNIIINVLMIRKIGLFAASISTVVSFIIIAIYRTWDLKKYANINVVC